MFKKIGYVLLGLTASLSAFAQVPAGVTSAISTATTDVTSVGGTILGVMIAIAVIMWIRKVLH